MLEKSVGEPEETFHPSAQPHVCKSMLFPFPYFLTLYLYGLPSVDSSLSLHGLAPLSLLCEVFLVVLI